MDLRSRLAGLGKPPPPGACSSAAILAACAIADAAFRSGSLSLACLAGIRSAIVVFGIKANGMFVIPVALVFFYVCPADIPLNSRWRRTWTAGLFIMGLGLAFVLWAVFWLPPLFPMWRDFAATVRDSQPMLLNPLRWLASMAQLLADLHVQRNLFPCLWLGEYCGLRVLLAAFLQRSAPAASHDLLMALWFWLGLLFFAVIPYHPPRYLLAVCRQSFWRHCGLCHSRCCRARDLPPRISAVSGVA